MTDAAPRKSPLVVESWPVDKPVPYARNARLIPDAAIGKVAASIKEFGWQQPIVVDEHGVILAGHTRLLAAQRLELESVPVHVAKGLTPAQAKAFRLMDNRSHDDTQWDYSLLGIELEELATMDIDVSLTGFEGPELARFADEDDAEAPEDFKDFGEDVPTEHECPSCGYKWSGGE